MEGYVYMKVLKICRTCEFNMKGYCGNSGVYEYNEQIKKDDIECTGWGAELKYFSELIDNAPWYIKDPYKRYEIYFGDVLELLEQDHRGDGVEINIYDAIEKIYGIRWWELSKILGVSQGVVSYAKTRGTIPKRKIFFSNCLHIPVEFFDTILSTQLDVLEQCKEKFYKFYGEEKIEKMRMAANEDLFRKP